MQDDIERFLVQGQSIGWRDNTLANYRYLLALTVDFLARRGCRRFADVTRDDLEAFMAHLAAEQHAKSSLLRASALLRRYFAWLQDQGRIVADPTKGLPVPDWLDRMPEDLPSVFEG